MQNPAVISFWQKNSHILSKLPKKNNWRCLVYRLKKKQRPPVNCIIHRSVGPWPEILSYPQDSIVDLGKIGSTWLRFLSANTSWSSCNNVTRHPLHEHKVSGQKNEPKSIHRFETSTLALHSPPDFGNVDCLPSWQGKWVRVVSPCKGSGFHMISSDKKTCQLHPNSIANIPWIKQLN